MEKVKFSIYFLCVTFVIWQCQKCFQKYFENPVGTKLSLVSTNEIPFPVISICPGNNAMPVNQEFLQECAIKE